jgi:hypothetical protein
VTDDAFVSDPSLTIGEFCRAEKLSRSKLYLLWAEGKGPRWFNIGSHKRISHEARTEWRQRLEAEAERGSNETEAA